MRDHELAMLAYVKLAAVSHEKQQLLGRNKFLVLTGAAACRAGWPEVAERCRELVLADNRMHLIGHFATFPDALRSPEFEPFVQQLERFCPYEKAELLLQHLGMEPGLPASSSAASSAASAGQFALETLDRLCGIEKGQTPED